MTKKLLSLLFPFFLSAQINLPIKTEQLLVVKASSLKSSTATLQAYEKTDGKWHKVFKTINVNLGRNGLAWDSQKLMQDTKETLKYEGDGKAPAGLFSLSGFFGYDKQDFHFPYKKLNSSDICVDDSDSAYYNKLIQTQNSSDFKSFEKMKRDDNLYKLGIIVDYNKEGHKQKGSCIFIHIQRAHNSPTAGCTSMQKEKLLKLMKWLEFSKKPMLLQLPKSKLLLLAPRLGLK